MVDADDEPLGIRFQVNGEPYPFATTGEKEWKLKLDRQVPVNLRGIKSSGVILDFTYTPRVHRGYFDVDNVCEPVFSVLVNKKGWFGGARKHIRWFTSTKRDEPEVGLKMLLRESEPPVFRADPSLIVFDRVFSGMLPLNASDAGFKSWVNQEKNPNSATYDGRYSVLLQFSSETINIGDIATGRVKNVVDCLHPITGDDRSVQFLQVEKGVRSVQAGGVRIVVATV